MTEEPEAEEATGAAGRRAIGAGGLEAGTGGAGVGTGGAGG